MMPIAQDQFLAEGQVRAICVACGAEKFEPFDRCETCGLEPQREGLVKATYLSVYRYFDDHKAAASYSRKLVESQTAIRSGQAVVFDQNELDRVRLWIETQVKAGPKPLGSTALIVMVSAVATAAIAIWYFS